MHGINCLPNFMKIYQSVQTLLLGYTHTDTHRQDGDLISLFPFLESRLIKTFLYSNTVSITTQNIKSLGLIPPHKLV
jgi:hypothetical protein